MLFIVSHNFFITGLINILQMRYLKQRDVHHSHSHGHAVMEGAGVGVALEAMFLYVHCLTTPPLSRGVAAVDQRWRAETGVPSISVAC